MSVQLCRGQEQKLLGRVGIGTMPSLLRALIVFALLCGSTAMAFLLKSHVLKAYTETGALESMNLIISFLVTITAIVIGL